MDRIIGGFDVDTYTDAPLRVSRAVYFDAPPKTVFVAISDHAHLENWMPLVRRVNLNRGHASAYNGVGTIRYLNTGAFTIREYIIAYDPPRLLAYSIEENPLVIDHVSVLLLQAERYGGTYLLWQHYFRTSLLPFITQPLASLVLAAVYTGALRTLIGHFGGKFVNRLPE